MKVVVAINGSLVAESTAFLALAYAKQQSLDLVLLHVKNHKDNIDDVYRTVKEIESQVSSTSISCEAVILKGHIKESVRSYFATINADTLFCSTRTRKSYITNSFSEQLLNLKLTTDVAIVRIVKMHVFKELEKILLPIKQSKLSVKKFTFLATLASAYNSKSEIFSISPASKNEISKMNISILKSHLSKINFDLRHYINLSRLIPFNLHIKHEFSSNETRSILTRIADSNCQLVVIGAKRFSFFSLFKGEKPIEQIFRETSENLIAYYPKEH